MRSSTLLSVASFALAVAPAIAQQHQDMREEIRRIVREEVRAAVHDAIQELHGMPAHHEGEEHREAQEGQKTERPAWRRIGPAQGEAGELRELEGEMKELESTLEKLQGEVGKRAGAQVHGLQLRGRLEGQNPQPQQPGNQVKTLKLAPGAFKVDGGEGQVFELKMAGGEMQMVTPQGQKAFQFHIDGNGETGEKAERKAKTQKLAPGVFKVEGGEGETIQLKLDGGEMHMVSPKGQNVFQIQLDDDENEKGEKAEKAERKVKAMKLAPGAFKVEGGEGETLQFEINGGEMHMVSPKGQNVMQLRLDDGDDEKGEKAEKKARNKQSSPRTMIWTEGDDEEKAEAPKTRKSTKSAKTPVGLNTIMLPMVGQPIATHAGDGCNCVIVIRCENGQCHIEGSCNGQPLALVQSKTKASKAKKAKGSDDDDDDDDGESSIKVEVKNNAGCCETTSKATTGCCETTTATTGKGDCCGCCEPKKAETTKAGAKEAPKKLIN
jgi:hypothetical protein